MRKKTTELIAKLHIVIDDVQHPDDNDDFASDKDAELRAALLTASVQLTTDVPQEMLLATDVLASLGSSQDYDAIQTQYTDGHGALVIPSDFLRLAELRLKSWSQSVRTLMAPDSQEAQMQASFWTRGTPQKPKAMLSTDSHGNRIIVYWTAGRYSHLSESMAQVYDHKIDRFTYAPYPRFEIDTSTDAVPVTEEYLYAPLTDACEKSLLYRAAAVYMEAKKESSLADRFYQLGQV